MIPIMLPAVLLLLGTGLILYALWELRRLFAALEEAEAVQRAAARRIDDLLADLDEAAAAVDRRTGRLETLLALVDAGPPAAPGPLEPAGSSGSLHRSEPTGPADVPAPVDFPGPAELAGRPEPPEPPAGNSSSEPVLQQPGADPERPTPAVGAAGGAPVTGAAKEPAPDEQPSGPDSAQGAGEEQADAAHPLRQRIEELAGRGLSEEAIAAALAVSRGEVRLVLALRHLREGAGPDQAARNAVPQEEETP